MDQLFLAFENLKAAETPRGNKSSEAELPPPPPNTPRTTQDDIILDIPEAEGPDLDLPKDDLITVLPSNEEDLERELSAPIIIKRVSHSLTALLSEGWYNHRQSFSDRRVTLEKLGPPSENPIGYSVFFIAAGCCAGTALGIIVFFAVVLFVFLVSVPLAALGMGSYYYNDCPITNIPLLLIIGGLLQVFQVSLSGYATYIGTVALIALLNEKDEGSLQNTDMIKKMKKKKKKEEKRKKSRGKVLVIGNLTLLAIYVLWNLAGSGIVYSIYPIDNSQQFKCNQRLYNFAFGYITTFYVILAILILILLIGFISYVFLNCYLDENPDNKNLSSSKSKSNNSSFKYK